MYDKIHGCVCCVIFHTIKRNELEEVGLHVPIYKPFSLFFTREKKYGVDEKGGWQGEQQQDLPHFITGLFIDRDGFTSYILPLTYIEHCSTTLGQI